MSFTLLENDSTENTRTKHDKFKSKSIFRYSCYRLRFYYMLTCNSSSQTHTQSRRLKKVAQQLAYKFHLPNSCSVAFYADLSVFYVIKRHKSKLGQRKLLIRQILNFAKGKSERKKSQTTSNGNESFLRAHCEKMQAHDLPPMWASLLATSPAYTHKELPHTHTQKKARRRSS